MSQSRRPRSSKRAAALALLATLGGFGPTRSARADEPPADGDSGGLPASFSAKPTDPERHDKTLERLGVLAVYTVFAAGVVGGDYLLRDNFVGRGVATTAAGWGGLGLGAALGWALSSGGGCHAEDCLEGDDAGAIVGGLVGTAAGSIAGYFLTTHDGMSRVYTTAAGMAPFILVLGVATIARW